MHCPINKMQSLRHKMFDVMVAHVQLMLIQASFFRSIKVGNRSYKSYACITIPISFIFTSPFRKGSTNFSGSLFVVDEFSDNRPPSIDSFNAICGVIFMAANFLVKQADDGIKRSPVQVIKNDTHTRTATLTFLWF